MHLLTYSHRLTLAVDDEMSLATMESKRQDSETTAVQIITLFQIK